MIEVWSELFGLGAQSPEVGGGRSGGEDEPGGSDDDQCVLADLRGELWLHFLQRYTNCIVMLRYLGDGDPQSFDNCRQRCRSQQVISWLQFFFCDGTLTMVSFVVVSQFFKEVSTYLSPPCARGPVQTIDHVASSNMLSNLSQGGSKFFISRRSDIVSCNSARTGTA